jgi:antitoxin ParD1/3/4
MRSTKLGNERNRYEYFVLDNLKKFVEQQVAGRSYGSSREYGRELIRHDKDRQHLRDLLLEGASSDTTEPVDAAYFDSLRARACGKAPGDRKVYRSMDFKFPGRGWRCAGAAPR